MAQTHSWLNKVRTILRLVREDRRQLWRLLRGQSFQMFVYALPVDSVLPAIRTPTGARVKVLSEDDFAALPDDPDAPGFGRQQFERVRRYGTVCAYGVYLEDALAHVTWLLPPALEAMERPRLLCLKEGEAEITASETLPRYRGRGLYPYVIQQIIDMARDGGVRTVYAKARRENLSSRTALVKAGLREVGTITVITPPAMPGKALVMRRFHAP